MKTYTLKTSNKRASPKLTIDYKKKLNDEQLNVVQNSSGPCLVLAGAGSGKTRTLIYRVAWLLEHGVHPQNILLVTFTNKAAHEMLDRVRTVLRDDIKGLWGGTFHHIGNRILRAYADRVGFNRNFSILDSSDAQELIASATQEVPLAIDKKIFPKSTTVKAVLSFATNAQLPIQEVVKKSWKKLNPFIPHLEHIQSRYEHKKRISNTMDYDDLLIHWLSLLKKNEDIRNQYTDQFHYILVDEYQDTNHIQAEIMHELAQKHQNILVVGDDAQSIYSFRAADVKNILEFPKRFTNHTIFKLESNYRSTPEILKLANASIKHNTRGFKKKLKNIRKSQQTKPGVIPLPDSISQAQFITQRITEFFDDGVSLNEIAILFRASHQTLELEVELTKQNIPYIKRGGLKYFEQAHIKDVVAYLKIALNPLDEISWRRVLKLYEGIGDKSAGILWRSIEQAQGNIDSVFENKETLPKLSSKSTASSQRAYQTIKQISKLIKEDARGDQMSELSKAITIILSQGYKSKIREKFDDPEERLDDLEQLGIFALSYQSIEQFLSDIALSEGFRGEMRTGEEEDESTPLVLSTIHQAKGLEWPVVFVIGLIEGQFPNSRAMNRGEDIEEERRLFYVAVTRAKDELYLTYPITSFFGSQLGRTFSGPSRFLTELPEDTYEPWHIDSHLDEPIINLDAIF